MIGCEIEQDRRARCGRKASSKRYPAPIYTNSTSRRGILNSIFGLPKISRRIFPDQAVLSSLHAGCALLARPGTLQLSRAQKCEWWHR